MSDTIAQSNRPKIKPIIAGEKLRGAEKMARIPVKLEKTVTPLRKPDWIRIRLPNGNKIQELKAQLRDNKLHTVCEEAAQPQVHTKSGLMLGIGETLDQVKDVLRDLKAHDCDMITLGQYLQPGLNHLPIERYLHPDEFEQLRIFGEQLGFKHVASGPMVRSSYHADEQTLEAEKSA